MAKSDIVYVALPYSHEDKEVEEQRFEAANEYTSLLTKMGVVVLSPISMMHPVAKYGLPTDWEFWEKFDKKLLSVCGEMHVLCIQGWENSIGVKGEIKIAESLGIQIKYIR